MKGDSIKIVKSWRIPRPGEVKHAVRLRFDQINDHTKAIPVKSVLSISKIVRISERTLHRVLNHWKETGEFVRPIKKSTRKRKLEDIKNLLLSK